MPPRPPLVNTVKLEMQWSGPNSTKANNIMYALMATGWTPTITSLTAVANNLAAATIAGATASLVSQIASDWTLSSVLAADNGGTTEDTVVIPASHQGQVSANSLPPNCCATISWTIPAHYRGGHPRTYLSGIPEGNATIIGGNWWSTTFRSALATAAQNFLQSFITATAGGIAEQLGTMAFKRNNVPLTTPVFYPFSGGLVHQRMDSQRRRLGKENVNA